MSQRARNQRSPRGEPGRRSPLFVLFAVLGVVVMIAGVVVGILPALVSGDSPGDEPVFRLPVTPGAEEEAMRQRLEENPDDVGAMIVLADLLANSGRTSEAIRWYDEAVQRRPDDPELRVAFGRALARSGHTLDAELQYKKASELEPTNPEPLFLLAELYEQSEPPRTDEAKWLYEQVVELAPDSVYADRARERLSGR